MSIIHLRYFVVTSVITAETYGKYIGIIYYGYSNDKTVIATLVQETAVF